MEKRPMTAPVIYPSFKQVCGMCGMIKSIIRIIGPFHFVICAKCDRP